MFFNSIVINVMNIEPLIHQSLAFWRVSISQSIIVFTIEHFKQITHGHNWKSFWQIYYELTNSPITLDPAGNLLFLIFSTAVLFGARIHSHSLIGVDDFFRSYISFHCYVKSHIYKKGDGNAVYDWALGQQPSKWVPSRMWDIGAGGRQLLLMV